MSIKAIIITTALVVAYAFISNDDYCSQNKLTYIECKNGH
jgi:hypothetical protein